MTERGFPESADFGAELAPGVLFACPGCGKTVSIGIDSEGKRRLLHGTPHCASVALVTPDSALEFVAAAVAVPSNAVAVAESAAVLSPPVEVPPIEVPPAEPLVTP